ncbi:uncharacterized protein EI90DRAFT_3119510 [Cantharellus anzutake]|nr:uncharacterized protein EI90DRAFT_3119510 [Cantharellus anzutake]KAF8337119.1 hypothetical protein EI90DRAFT_3119510 [Cantharellus anzutake]
MSHSTLDHDRLNRKHTLLASSVSSSSSMKSGFSTANNVWGALASKAQTFFLKTGRFTIRGNSTGKRIKPITKLATIYEKRADEEHKPSKASTPSNVEREKLIPRAVLAVDYKSPVGMFHMPKAIGIVLESEQQAERCVAPVPVKFSPPKPKLPTPRRVPVPSFEEGKENAPP